MAARDACDVFQSLVADSCDLAGFHRSALFVYNPLTKTVEGLFAHQVELDAVRRIRESERRIPLLYEVTRLHKPVFLDDVSPFLPPQYVRHFQLTSLLVCPVRGPADQSIGVLLVDEGGRRFPHSPAQSELLYRMLNRVSLSLASHLQVGRLPAHTAPCILTERELDVLHLIADGLHTKSAAERLHISEHTVTEHVTSILRKLGVTNRAAAVAKALREGFIR